jgi:cobalt/nickel transport system permease protein
VASVRAAQLIVEVAGGEVMSGVVVAGEAGHRPKTLALRLSKIRSVLGIEVSEPGLHAGLALLVKGTMGVVASLTLAATTQPQDLLRGLQRLRMPDLIVQIMGFMIRYLDVVTAELGRMMTALRSRGCDPRSPRHWPVLARSLGALFIRSYERGERVHLAMLSRGYDGRLPQTEDVR